MRFGSSLKAKRTLSPIAVSPFPEGNLFAKPPFSVKFKVTQNLGKPTTSRSGLQYLQLLPFAPSRAAIVITVDVTLWENQSLA